MKASMGFLTGAASGDGAWLNLLSPERAGSIVFSAILRREPKDSGKVGRVKPFPARASLVS